MTYQPRQEHKVCEYCGKDFSFDYRERSVRKYCSWECKVAASRGMPLNPESRVYTTCDTCGKQMWYHPSQAGGRKEHFCSHECVIEGHKRFSVTLTCKYCNQPFMVKRHKENKRQYCSPECARKAKMRCDETKEGKKVASTAVCAAVRTARIPPASNFPCAMCQGPARLYHHHNGYGADSRFDVIPLCYSCHSKVHNFGARLHPTKVPLDAH